MNNYSIVMNYMAAHEIDHEEDLPDVVSEHNLSLRMGKVQSAWQKHIALLFHLRLIYLRKLVEDVVSLC